MTMTTLYIEYVMWGLDPGGYHVTNWLLHATAVVLVWRLLVQLEVPGAWLAAAIFAVHPVCVESVARICERKNPLSLSLALASMIAYLRFTPPAEMLPWVTSTSGRKMAALRDRLSHPLFLGHCQQKHCCQRSGRDLGDRLVEARTDIPA